MGVWHWVFGKHPPRPADPERAVMVANLPHWQAQIVIDELAADGITATASEDQVVWKRSGQIEAGSHLYVMEPDADAARAAIARLESAPPPTYGLRPGRPDDRAFLRDMLWQAIFVPEGEARPDDSIVDHEPLSLYLDIDYGEGGDVVWIAEDEDGQPIGACWTRLMSANRPGYGFVDDRTPELSIAVDEPWRDQGVGSALLEMTCEDRGRLSLSVDERNPAISLYRRFGFVEVARDGHSVTMLRDDVD